MPPTPRVYKPKPGPGIHEQVINRLQDREGAKYKARVLAGTSLPITPFTHAGVTVKVRPNAYWYDEDKGLLSVIVEHATTSDGIIVLPINNPYQFVNPPLKIGDGTFRKEPHPLKAADSSLPDIDVENMVENASLAFQRIVCEAVADVAKQRGVL